MPVAVRANLQYLTCVRIDESIALLPVSAMVIFRTKPGSKASALPIPVSTARKVMKTLGLPKICGALHQLTEPKAVFRKLKSKTGSTSYVHNKKERADWHPYAKFLANPFLQVI